MKVYAIILASGSSKRFGEKVPKQFVKIQNKTILEHTVEAFDNNKLITDIIVVCHPNYLEFAKNLLTKEKFNKIKIITEGGNTRQESSYIGVSFVKENNAKVLIHDAARPFVKQEIINDCILALDKFEAVGVAIESNDTIVKIDEKGFVAEIPNRSFLRRMQTPQAFKASIIKKAHKLAKDNPELFVTDDCGMVLYFHLAQIAIIKGNEDNIKITRKSDLPN